MPPLRYYSQFQEFNLCVNFFFGCFLFFPPISAILGNLSTQNNLLIVLCREQGDDMCAAQFSSHFACVRTQTEPLSTPPAAKFLWLRLIIFLPPSPVFFSSLPPAVTPSNRPVPVAMAIARTHLAYATTARGLLTSSLMSTALPSSFKVSLRPFGKKKRGKEKKRKFGFSRAWLG